ncbi:MAG: apolipoprotein N-acyltransferase [Candidatus Firestonebacteria bacterium]|nr:apolipoprotein N-acyltransferase [Candidatus Firestonebacteria bacterium]
MLSWPNVWVASFSAVPGYLAWVSLVPFIYLWRQSGWRGAFVQGWVLGFIYYLGILSWITLINRDTNVSNQFTWLIFSVCGAFYMGLFSATSKFVSERLRWPDALVLPLGWVAWEYLRGHVLFGGWPWGSLGHTQYSNVLIRQIAATAGVGGISFLVAWVNVILAQALARVVASGWGAWPGAWPQAVKPAAWRAKWQQRPVLGSVTALLVTLWVVLLGVGAVEAVMFVRAPQKHFRVALLQGNTDTTARWDRAYKTSLLDRMQRLHLQAVAQKPALIIWAESCFPGILDYPSEREWEDRLRGLVKTGGVPTLLTSNEYVQENNADGQGYHHYNSSFLLGPAGETLGRYRKIKLVPFGEYIPWEILKKFLHAVVREPIPVDFEPGHEYASLVFGDLNLSPLICYEDHFEELGFQLARRGARLFAGMANDRWAGTSAMSYQHTAMSVFLAIEHRVYMAKANMTGPTCLIDPWGNISRPLPYFQEGFKLEDVAYTPNYRTFFTRFGNIVVFSFLILFFSLLAVAFAVRKRA